MLTLGSTAPCSEGFPFFFFLLKKKLLTLKFIPLLGSLGSLNMRFSTSVFRNSINGKWLTWGVRTTAPLENCIRLSSSSSLVTFDLVKVGKRNMDFLHGEILR